MLGKLVERDHGVSGEVLVLSPRTLLIKNFKYDGSGDDTFFVFGTSGSMPSENGHILPCPFNERFYSFADKGAPPLSGQFNKQDVVELTLPAEIKVDQIKWISIWSRQFSVSYGDFIVKETKLQTLQIYLGKIFKAYDEASL